MKSIQFLHRIISKDIDDCKFNTLNGINSYIESNYNNSMYYPKILCIYGDDYNENIENINEYVYICAIKKLCFIELYKRKLI